MTLQNDSNGISDKFWGDDPNILVQPDRLVQFFPSSDQSLEERMNSLTRLVLYISITLSVYQEKTTSLYFGIFLVILIYFIWKNQTITQLNEPFAINPTSNKEKIKFINTNPENCRMPTLMNPYMNSLYGDPAEGPPACKGPGIQETAANLLNQQLFSDTDDLFERNANQRLFITTPGTSPKSPNTNDRDKFVNWMIKGTGNCKIDKQCAPFDDLRLSRQLIPEDLEKDFQDVQGYSF